MTAVAAESLHQQVPQVDRTAYKKARKHHLKSIRNRPPDDVFDWTPFRAAEKKYKARFPPPDLSNVIDLALMDESRMQEVNAGVWKGKDTAEEVREVGLNVAETGTDGRRVKAYCLKNAPGLVILPGYLSPSQQRDLVRWSLSEHSKWPNETNLDTHYDIPREGIWSMHLRSSTHAPIPNDSDSSTTRILPKVIFNPPPPSATLLEPIGPRQLIQNTPASPTNYQELSAEPKPAAAPSPTVVPATATELLPRLRWANIGWFYHWGTKQYDFARGKVEINEQVRSVCKGVVEAVEWEDVFGGGLWDEGEEEWKAWNSTYEPDAGIVNFYQLKDTLMGHVDRSEVCATSPLVSISLGNASIFLIGGQTRDVEPTPIRLRSGDVVVMSGPHCRRAYHGVPRILEGTFPQHLNPDTIDDVQNDDWIPYGKFLANARININVRQVFPKGFNPFERVDSSDGQDES